METPMFTFVAQLIDLSRWRYLYTCFGAQKDDSPINYQNNTYCKLTLTPFQDTTGKIGTCKSLFMCCIQLPRGLFTKTNHNILSALLGLARVGFHSVANNNIMYSADLRTAQSSLDGGSNGLVFGGQRDDSPNNYYNYFKRSLTHFRTQQVKQILLDLYYYLRKCCIHNTVAK